MQCFYMLHITVGRDRFRVGGTVESCQNDKENVDV